MRRVAAGQCARPGVNEFAKIHIALVNSSVGVQPTCTYYPSSLYVSNVLG